MKSEKVVSIKVCKEKDMLNIVDLLRTKMHEKEVDAFFFGIKLSDGTYSTGYTGDYIDRPGEALIGLSLLSDIMRSKLDDKNKLDNTFWARGVDRRKKAKSESTG